MYLKIPNYFLYIYAHIVKPPSIYDPWYATLAVVDLTSFNTTHSVSDTILVNFSSCKKNYPTNPEQLQVFKYRSLKKKKNALQDQND